MSIRVLTERAVIPGREASVIRLLKKLQAEALQAPGFVSSTAFREKDHPTKFVVISEWHSASAWQNWVDKLERHTVLDEMRDHLFGPITHRVLVPVRDPDHETFLL